MMYSETFSNSGQDGTSVANVYNRYYVAVYTHI